MAITYNDLNLELRRAFLKAGIPGATLEARELCCFGSGKSREEFQRDGRMYMADETEQAIRALAVPAPIAIGRVLAPDLAGTGVALVATADAPR